MINTALSRTDAADIVERVVLAGDLSKLSAADRVAYYNETCRSIGLNPLTRPFEYITLNGKLTLYARKDATDQLRKIYSVSLSIVARDRLEDVYIVTARATLPDGRTDESTGVVNLGSLKGDALANALMKAETKAKRRVTLSICGLGWLDETEMQTIADARPANVNPQTGEIISAPKVEVIQPAAPSIAERRAKTIDAIRQLWDVERAAGVEQPDDEQQWPLEDYSNDGLKRLYYTVKARVEALPARQESLVAA